MEWLKDMAEIGHLVFLILNYVIASALIAGSGALLLYRGFINVTGRNPLGEKDEKL
jgi:hypothetical protein